MTQTTLILLSTLLLAPLAALHAADDAGNEAKPPQQKLERLQYNHPGLVVDLGVGLWAWPMPMDFDGDGDLDLVVNCEDKPYNGIYFFENATGDTSKNPLPVFKPGVRISKGGANVQVSYVDGQPVVLTPGHRHPDFMKSGIEHRVKLDLPSNIHSHKVRANMWRMVDYDGNGVQDLLVGVDDWTEYGGNAYDEKGRWMNGPLRGYVYLILNQGSNETPKWGEANKLVAVDRPVETYGWPSPNMADFDGDGDLDLLCGEFLDGFTYFQNVGSREQPKFALGKRVRTLSGAYLTMELQMITPTACDWDKDGHLDLVVGEEDGRVAFIRHSGQVVDGVPVFEAPRYFQQEAADVKFGALATPVGVDWDGDGDVDIISGNTAGNIAFFENLSGPGVEEPKWSAPVLLEAGGKVIRLMAGPNGSIQGPCEFKWGYTTLTVADWNGDGLRDLMVNSILGKVEWYQNIGTKEKPVLAAAQPVEVEWDGEQPELSYGWMKPEGKALLTQWRTTPVAVDWDGDGLMDLVMLDHEGYLAFFKREKREDGLVLRHPQRAFVADPAVSDAAGKGPMPLTPIKMEPGQPLRLTAGVAGGSGRRKICIVDWDGDGKLDILLNSANANFLKQTRAVDGNWYFVDMGPLAEVRIEGHDVSPTTVDFNGDGKPDYLGGAEDGRFYYMPNPTK
jgi:hypothetical protein